MDSSDFHLAEKRIAKNKKRLFWYLILVFILFGVILFYYFENVNLQQQNVEINIKNEDNLEKLSELKIKSDARVDTLTSIILELEKSKDSLILSHKKTETITKESELELSEKRKNLYNEIERLKNSKYLITNHSYMFPVSGRRKISAYLKNEGYSKIEGWTYDDEGKKPSWMSLNSTVLFYSEKSEEKAQKIAENLSELTGHKYGTTRGKGLGVIKGQEDVTFFIHSVGTK